MPELSSQPERALQTQVQLVEVRPVAEATINAESIYFGDVRGKLYALDLATGQRKWIYEARDTIKAQPVVLTDTLELENLDYNEFEASFDSINLALATHLGALAPYREG